MKFLVTGVGGQLGHDVMNELKKRGQETENKGYAVTTDQPDETSEQTQLPDDRLCVKPGVSCYWQISDTAKMGYEEQLELDYKYIRERGVGTDLKIIWKTVRHIFKGDNC